MVTFQLDQDGRPVRVAVENLATFACRWATAGYLEPLPG
jgi:hypothetical protein